jgi:hypothetical protein
LEESGLEPDEEESGLELDEEESGLELDEDDSGLESDEDESVFEVKGDFDCCFAAPALEVDEVLPDESAFL